MKKMLMGNEAIALGAISAGVDIVTGYPGTPSTEVLEAFAVNKKDWQYVEWSTNEKTALEVAAGGAYTGAYTMVTMKQVGLNVASDPLMSLAYVGIKGAMVVMVADDPGPISSQTEQDTRHFGEFSKLPVFDPSSAAEAYEMIGDAFEYSHAYQTPVIFRPTTRVCHGYGTVEISETQKRSEITGFEKSSKWVIFPRLAYANHIKMEERNVQLQSVFSEYPKNTIEGDGVKGIATGGVSYAYVKENFESDCKLLKVATPHPFPKQKALEFMKGLSEVLVIEELDPVIEKALLQIKAENNLDVVIKGKLTGDNINAGENSSASVKNAMNNFLGKKCENGESATLPPLPIRPPVLCAGCPHRASFYAVKLAMKNQKAVFCGDIGCYTLGNAMPLDMTDTCLCMGAGITIAQGIKRAEPDMKNFAFVGDSTFFHTGIPGVVNALYNQTDLFLIVLDNKTTAMTGNQPHPGMGNTMMGCISEKISIKKVLEALGVSQIKVCDPFQLESSISAVKELSEKSGVKVIIFESPCISVAKKGKPLEIKSNCVGCGRCVSEIGCPAIFAGKIPTIQPSLCTGCGLCQSVCKVGAIGGVSNV
ncbi:MAG: indolepyruvate ferredoxin oxidoreductase subunit alpha [Bacillota bacterium]